MSSSARVKQAEDGDDIVVRLAETIGRAATARVRFPAWGGSFETEIGPFEIRTFRVACRCRREAVETDLLERPLEPAGEGDVREAVGPASGRPLAAVAKQRRGSPRPTETRMQRPRGGGRGAWVAGRETLVATRPRCWLRPSRSLEDDVMSRFEESITVAVPVRVAYNQWTQFEDFPKFMDGVKSVKQLDDRTLVWTASVAGKEKQWEAEITDQTPDTRIAWKSTEGAENAGAVLFNPVGTDRDRGHASHRRRARRTDRVGR